MSFGGENYQKFMDVVCDYAFSSKYHGNKKKYNFLFEEKYLTNQKERDFYQHLFRKGFDCRFKITVGALHDVLAGLNRDLGVDYLSMIEEC